MTTARPMKGVLLSALSALSCCSAPGPPWRQPKSLPTPTATAAPPPTPTTLWVASSPRPSSPTTCAVRAHHLRLRRLRQHRQHHRRQLPLAPFLPASSSPPAATVPTTPGHHAPGHHRRQHLPPAHRRHPITRTNALGHVERFEYDPASAPSPRSPTPTARSAPSTLDDFGRKTRETGPSGTSTIYRYCYITGRVSDLSSNTPGCDGSVPAEAR